LHVIPVVKVNGVVLELWKRGPFSKLARIPVMNQ
jgi:hypothetical protein